MHRDIFKGKHNTIIEGHCPNYDNCGNTFSKLFVSLKNNMYCHDCTTKVKYNYETLLKICNENNYFICNSENK